MTVILVIHILACLVLVGVVLMQRSEGGALGVGGGGGGGGGLMSGRGAAGALVRTTIIFGAIFFITSLVLTTITTRHLGDDRTSVERQLDEEFGGDGAAGGFDVDDLDAPLLDDEPATATIPSGETSQAPATDTTETPDPLAADVPPDAGSQGTEESSDDADAGETSQADQPQQ